MPTRILDIGDLATPPRILVTDGKNEEYATLSYCWGKGYQQPITTSYNLEQRRTALYLTTLPPVFQDAVTITRKLGFRYLWIDSLCILQDSVDDWNAESAKMDQYYTGSSFNIIAAAAEDPTCGIFDSADFLRHKLSYTKLPEYRIKGQNFVQKRAWTLQEEILPPRSIFYTGGAIHWICDHESYSEICPAQASIMGYRLHSESLKKRIFHPPRVRWDKRRQHVLPLKVVNGDKVKLSFFSWWYEILNHYSRRELSFDRDRFPGIAGLAKEFARFTDAQYLCGLWREDFITGLCWNGYGAGIKSSEYLGPTWSWATLHPLNRPDFLYHYPLTERNGVDDKNTTEIVDIHVVNEAQDPYGQVKEAVVVLEGLSRKLNTLSNPSYRSFLGFGAYGDQIWCSLDDKSRYSAGFPISAHPETIYLQLGRWENNAGQRAIPALVLEPTGRKNVHFSEYIEYRRIGLASFPPNDEFTKGWIKQKVVII